LPAQAENLRFLVANYPGEVAGAWSKLGGMVRLWEAQWALDRSETSWSEIMMLPNSRSFKLSDLPRGKDVWVRMRAAMWVGAGMWSDLATISKRSKRRKYNISHAFFVREVRRRGTEDVSLFPDARTDARLAGEWMRWITGRCGS
jgi:hypothetical protein